MSTAHLIQQLAASPRPRTTVARGALAALAPTLLGTLALVVAGWGLRDDLAAELARPMPAAKLLLPTLAALAAFGGALRLARPEGELRGALAALGALAAGALGLLAVGLALTPRDAWAEALRGDTLVACLWSVPTLAVLPTLGLMLAFRRGASLAPGRSGALAGLTGGGAAAALYALHCPEDNPIFFVTWYGTGMLMATAAGALLGSRLLRW